MSVRWAVLNGEGGLAWRSGLTGPERPVLRRVRENLVPVLLYDGDCPLCSRAVRLVLRHDARGLFRFARQGSSVGRRLLAEHGLEGGGSLVLLEDDRAYLRSEAVLRTAGRLGATRLASLLRTVPQAWRDRAYDAVARRRGALARRLACPALPEALRGRFLDLDPTEPHCPR